MEPTEYKVLAELTEDEAANIITVHYDKASINMMLDRLKEQLSDAQRKEDEWFNKIRSKYGIEPGPIHYHFNLDNGIRQIREGVYRG